MKNQSPIFLGDGVLSIEEVHRSMQSGESVCLSESTVVHERIQSSRAVIETALREGRTLYGITTGFGAAVENRVDAQIAARMPTNLMRYHGCGTGPFFSPELARAIVVVRTNSLARGYSGVRPELLQILVETVRRDVLPAIPEEGSVGASGDLTPLSYVAALLCGEREAFYRGELMEASEALRRAELTPLELAPKESLAIMNGTSVMAALACESFVRAERLAEHAALATAMASDVMMGHRGHFDAQIFALKPHVGQARIASWIYALLHGKAPIPDGPSRAIQDRYSLRCAPHVVGLILDSLPWLRTLIETEINGVNDNPIVVGATPEFPEGRVLHGGNFYGGHVCLATDTLKNVVANVAELLERQIVSLNQPRMSRDLPANLVLREDPDRFTHHGFKAMEITASALVAESLKLTMPASVFSRSTESHNQDKVSMGTISARESRRILDLAENVLAIHLLMVAQAVDIRGPESCADATRTTWQTVRTLVPKNDADRRMDVDITAIRAAIVRGDFLRDFARMAGTP